MLWEIIAGIVFTGLAIYYYFSKSFSSSKSKLLEDIESSLATDEATSTTATNATTQKAKEKAFAFASFGYKEKKEFTKVAAQHTSLFDYKRVDKLKAQQRKLEEKEAKKQQKAAAAAAAAAANKAFVEEISSDEEENDTASSASASSSSSSSSSSSGGPTQDLLPSDPVSEEEVVAKRQLESIVFKRSLNVVKNAMALQSIDIPRLQDMQTKGELTNTQLQAFLVAKIALEEEIEAVKYDAEALKQGWGENIYAQANHLLALQRQQEEKENAKKQAEKQQKKEEERKLREAEEAKKKEVEQAEREKQRVEKIRQELLAEEERAKKRKTNTNKKSEAKVESRGNDETVAEEQEAESETDSDSLTRLASIVNKSKQNKAR